MPYSDGGLVPNPRSDQFQKIWEGLVLAPHGIPKFGSQNVLPDEAPDQHLRELIPRGSATGLTGLFEVNSQQLQCVETETPEIVERYTQSLSHQ